VKHTLSVLVENRAGVLSRISGLFSRRGFNIESLAVGITEDPSLSRMTIVVEGNEYTVEQVEKQLNKLVDVIKVRRLEAGELLSRELMLVKVNADVAKRGEIMNIAEIMEARIIDISLNTLTLEISATPEKIDLFEELLKPYIIKELVRTGMIAIEKGADTINTKIQK